MTADRVLNTQRLIPSTRFTLALLVSFALFVQYAQRISLSMGIVCLVNRTALVNATPPTLTKYGSNLLQDRQFPWTELQQQILLGSYWFGYIFTLVPSKPPQSHLLFHASPSSISFPKVVGYRSYGALNGCSLVVFSQAL